MTEAARASRLHRGMLELRDRFEPRKLGHVFCSSFCSHRGERRPHERTRVDHDAVERLFAADRDPDERCREDDWFPESCAELKELYGFDTVATRRRWYGNLLIANR